MQANGGSGVESNAMTSFVKQLLQYLDASDTQSAEQCLRMFRPSDCKVVVNTTPFSSAMDFLAMWQQRVVLTQHALTLLDFHAIPGSGAIVCNVNAKLRFDESGRDRAGLSCDAVNPANPTNAGMGAASGPRNGPPQAKQRPLWGPNFGVSLQLVLDERVYQSDIQGVISSLNYTTVFKPDDSLIDLR